MKLINFFSKKTDIISKTYENQERDKKIVLLEISGKLKEKLLNKFNKNFSLNGSYLNNNRVLSKEYMSNLILAGISAKESFMTYGVNSSNIFLATADPDTLMKINEGVGSAVIKNGKIIGQAPFIPMNPIQLVAPTLLFQAISSILILKKFEIINQKLDSLKTLLNDILKLYEIKNFSEIISIQNIVDELENEYGKNNIFSTDAIFKLVLIEYKINTLFEEYKIHYKKIELLDKVSSKIYNGYILLILSLLNLRTHILKINLSLQQSSKNLDFLIEKFLKKQGEFLLLIKESKNNNDYVKNILKDSDIHIGSIRTEIARIYPIINKIDIIINDIEKNKNELFEIPNVSKQTLLYWRDEMGTIHSYYVDEKVLDIINIED